MIVVAMLVAFAFNAIESNATSESVQCNRECTAEKLECSDECRMGEDAIDRSEVIQCLRECRIDQRTVKNRVTVCQNAKRRVSHVNRSVNRIPNRILRLMKIALRCAPRKLSSVWTFVENNINYLRQMRKCSENF